MLFRSCARGGDPTQRVQPGPRRPERRRAHPALLDGVEGLSKIVADIEIGQKYIIENISQIKETLPGPVPRRPSRIRLGSRPMEVSGFVERREQAGLFGAVFCGQKWR